MWFSRRLPKIKKRKLSRIEYSFFEHLCKNTETDIAEKVRGQLSYLVYQRRVDYKTNLIIELYPKSYGDIPDDLLFARSEEFLFAKLACLVGDQKYVVKINAVLGRIFDLCITPIPKDGDVYFLEMEVENNLTENVIK